MKLLRIFEKSKDIYFLIGALFLFFLLRLPSLFEPYWYGDEGIYQVIGIAMRQGRLLYRDIWDNKPPLLYFLYSLFNSDQFSLRLISLIFGILAVVAFFLLVKKLFSSKLPIFLSTSFFAVFFGLPLLEGNIANSENFMLFPILLTALIIFKYSTYKNKNESKYHFAVFASGLILSFAFLFKIVAIFDFAAFVIFLFLIEYKRLKDFIPTVVNLLSFISGFALPIIFTALFFIFNHAFSDFLTASFKQNVGYVGYGNKFIIPQGLLIFKLFLLFSFSLFLFIKRKKINATTMFILLWFAFSLFNAFFSQRPYIHYLLVLLPAFSLFLGLLAWDKKLQKVYLIVLILLLIVLSTSFKVYGKTNKYYQNFLTFVLNKESLDSYRAFFDRNTLKDYELVQFVKSHTKETDSVYVWGNNAQVYKMTNKLPPGRFTVAYHVTASPSYINETENALKKIKPKYIIVTSPENPIPFPLINYELRFNVKGSEIYERSY
ncbi:MAG: glycosyltransferase family 39 protein [Patescibacteria group bacterium]|nr:glycosyltransferase family 39 protein [Patescibacteria group bacterium]